MHEFGPVQACLETVLSHLTPGAGRVRCLRLRYGAGLAEAPIRQAYAALSKGTALEAARLEVEAERFMVRCPCRRKFIVTSDELTAQSVLCPGCGAVRVIEEARPGLRIAGLDLEPIRPTGDAAAPQRLRIRLQGAVQGMGTRPAVYRLARRWRLGGWVRNTAQGLCLEIEGSADSLAGFVRQLDGGLPAQAEVTARRIEPIPPQGDAAFLVESSDGAGPRTAWMLPDLAVCDACRRDIADPSNRRWRYPFTNCTDCGPRFSIIEALPYDRSRTTMRAFAMCPACRAEYHDPEDRRFHAQPNACPACGPQLAWWDGAGRPLASRQAALAAAVRALEAGAIVAVKGLGGFHLMVDARQEAAVRRLRQRKCREAKPLAVMCPSLEGARRLAEVSEEEARLLASPAAPIVLLHRRPGAQAIAPSVAPNNPWVGAMLPYTPLHALLLEALGRPVVATSGNRSDEPICTDEQDALIRLRGIADLWLVHNRPIARAVDDSVVRVALDRPLMLRRARGFAPQPAAACAAEPEVMALGAHLNTTVGLTVGGRMILSQHLGDLETPQAVAAFQQASAQLPALYERSPGRVACDAHPDFPSTRFARGLGRPVIAVQHHEAHVRACLAEHGLSLPAFGAAWDGTGYGCDGTIWGGEWLVVGPRSCERVAHLRPFPLPGAEEAVRQGRRAAIGLLYALAGEAVFGWSDLPSVRLLTAQERAVFPRMLSGRLRSPLASSVGRLFDAAASLLGLQQVNQFEGQAAMALEWAADGAVMGAAYPVRIEPCPLTHAEPHAQEPWHVPTRPGHLWVDWEPMVFALLDDVRQGVAPGAIAAKFHRALAVALREVAQRQGAAVVALGGGCFQNRVLLEQAVRELASAGLRAFWPQRLPPGDGGIAAGQLMAAQAREH